MSSNNKTGGFRVWLVRLLTRFLFLLIIFIAGALTMHFGMHGNDHDNMVQLQTTIDIQNKQIQTLQAGLAQSQSSSSIKQGTKKALEDQITALQQELTDVRDQLSFYEQLVPPGIAGSISIRAFSAEQKGDVVDYRILLTRNVKAGAQPFDGHMQFIAIGTLDGEDHKQTLTSVADNTENDPFAIHFERFQRSAGVLQLEPEFKVLSIQLEILENDKLRAKGEAILGEKQ